MNNKNGYIIYKLGLKKRRRHMIIYSIYKSNHPIIPKDVVNVHDLGYLGVEKDFPVEQLSSLPYKKIKRIVTTRKGLQQPTFKKENNDRTYHHL